MNSSVESPASARALALRERVRSTLDVVLTPYAHAVFSRNRVVGLLILAAAATEPRYLVFGTCALLAAELTVRLARLKHSLTPYGYNALLCGIALAHEHAFAPESLAFAGALGCASAFATAALTALASYVAYLPVLSTPFVLTTWGSLAAASRWPLPKALPERDAWTGVLPAWLELGLQSLGSLLLVPNVLAGLCVFVALGIHSRISLLLGSSSALLVLGVLQLAHAPLGSAALQAIGSSAGLAAIAIGAVCLIPSRQATLVALATAAMAALLALGLAAPLSRLGLSLAFVPYNAAVLLMLCALRQRGLDARPPLATALTDTPEQLLANHVSQPKRSSNAGPTLHLPFSGAWMCTQGVDGAYTHRGVLRHAYDFEMVNESDRALCAGQGTRPQDFHCFGQPVLAAADGTVVAVENGVANNGMGEDNPPQPWGNHVILNHAGLAYSVVAHLAQSSVVVYPGQFVTRGTLLGYCGNSGRAPRPHLHFQLQAVAVLGTPTLPSAFSDVVVSKGGRKRFEPLHVPAMGEMLQPLQLDAATGAYFYIPPGAVLSYRTAGRTERIRSEIDAWGRSILRSLDRRAELVMSYTEHGFSCGELRGDPDSVLALFCVALSNVPYCLHPELTFRVAIPERWLCGRLRALLWDLSAPFAEGRGLELESRIQGHPHGVSIMGRSLRRWRDDSPLFETRAVLGGAVGPTLIEVTTFARTRRAELIPKTEEAQAVVHSIDEPRLSPLAVGLGDRS